MSTPKKLVAATKVPRDWSKTGEHCSSAAFALAVGPWAMTSVTDEKFEITVVSDTKLSVRSRLDTVEYVVPMSNVIYYVIRSK